MQITVGGTTWFKGAGVSVWSKGTELHSDDGTLTLNGTRSLSGFDATGAYSATEMTWAVTPTETFVTTVSNAQLMHSFAHKITQFIYAHTRTHTHPHSHLNKYCIFMNRCVSTPTPGP